jgi:hypothetical protein
MKYVRSLVVMTSFSLFGAVCWAGCTDDENPANPKDGGGAADPKKDTGTADAPQTLDATLGDTGRQIQLTVADYCLVMTQSCAGQYPSPASCTAAATRMVLGTVTDTNVDTLGCRLRAAVGGQCAVASASGGGVCGSRCESFCRLASNDTPLGFCRKLVIDAGVDANDGAVADGAAADGEAGTGEGGVVDAGAVDAGFQYQEPYASHAACLSACSAYPVDNNEAYGSSGPSNNYNCRMYHLLNGMGLGPGPNGKIHCEHIAQTSATCNQ